MKYKILILEDNHVDSDLIRRHLERSDFNFVSKQVALKKDYKRELESYGPHLILSDYNLQSFDAYDALQIKNELCKDIPLVVISGAIGEEKAVHLIKAGAIDFLIKDNMARLPQIVMRAIEETVEKKERERAEQALKNEKYFTDTLLDSLSGIFYVLDIDLKVRRVNKKFVEMLGYTWDEVKGNPVRQFIAEDDHSKMEKAFQQIYDEGEASVELCLQHKDGFLNHYLLTGSHLQQEENGYILGTGINISDRIKAEQEMKEALKEREILLMEIHHRVKNNLAVVSGLLELQGYEIEDKMLKEKLNDCQARVKSIALIHELLYASNTFSHISIDETVKRLVEEVALITETDHQIDVKVNLDTVELNVNQAIPCTLILNELLTNIYKHAFPDRKRGEIDLTLKETGGRIHLSLKDNGVGLPENVTVKSASTLGFKLVEVLSKQLNAEFDYQSDGGSTFHLSFEKSDKKGSGSALHTKKLD